MKRLIILGTGFAGFSVAKKVDTSLYEVTIVSPRNHFLFTPLLPSTTVGTVEFRSIIEPVHTARSGIRYIHASTTSIDPAGQIIHCKEELGEGTFSLRYDYAVVAVGAINDHHGVLGVVEHAFFLKELNDARAIRQRIIECFERANIPGASEEAQRQLLHFVVVGGGPTGVEFAAEMHDFLVDDISKAFPHLAEKVRISLLEATNHILDSFDEALSGYALKRFHRQGIDVRMNALVARVEPSHIHLSNGDMIPCGLVVWSTGIAPSPFVQSLPWLKDKGGKILVDNYLQVKGFQSIFALGDCAAIEGKTLPPTAQVAQQQGFYLAAMLNRRARHKLVKAFEYRNLGMLAYIGGHRALADLQAVKWHGFTTWLFWRSAYLTRLVSFKNKILVIFDWWKALMFGRDVSRF